MYFATISHFTLGQACCSGGVPLGGTLGLGTADRKSVQFLLTYDRNVLNDLMERRDLLDDDTRSRLTTSTILEINYGINERFAVAAVLPFVQQERIIKGFEGRQDFTRTQGIGDVVFLLKYRMLNPEKFNKSQWVIGAGPKIPTGRTDFRNNNGLILQADMQPGSGSLDGMLWSFFQQSQFLIPQLSFLNINTFRLSGKNRNYNQSQEYQFGDELQVNLGINYNFLLKWPTDLFLFGRYRSQTVDLIDDNVFPGSGGKWVYLIPGFNIGLHPDFAIRGSVDLPVYRKLLGTQLTTTYKYTLSVFFNLSGKENKAIINKKFDEL